MLDTVTRISAIMQGKPVLRIGSPVLGSISHSTRMTLHTAGHAMRRDISILETLPELMGHQINGTAILPGMYAVALLASPELKLEGISFQSAIPLEGAPKRLVIAHNSNGCALFENSAELPFATVSKLHTSTEK